VSQVRHTQQAEQKMRHLLKTTFADLPSSGHRQLITVPGFGEATCAVLTAKIINIDRFPTDNHLIGYFGVFPEENRSGVDKQGKPLPPGTMCMSHKGNDLARFYLWNAARVAIRHNPAVRALYARLKAKGKRGDVAMGQCMAKLLRFAFAVWKTDRPFDDQHFPWVNPDDTQLVPATANPGPTIPASTNDQAAPAEANEKAAGHTREDPARKVVTTASSSVETTTPPVKPASSSPAGPTPSTARPRVDFVFLRPQVTMEQVLTRLGLFEPLRGRGQQRRGPCPIHGQPTDTERTFSVNLGKNLFQCFHAECAAHGNVLDFWAAVHRLPLYEAALHLAATFNLPRNREEELLKEPVKP
jgi:hypothetical protein